MQNESFEIPAEALAALAIVRATFGSSLAAVYLHGSAVSGGLRPQSDVDALVVIDRPMTEPTRASLVASLLAASGQYPISPGRPRCIELMVLLQSELAAPHFPAKCEFLYGEWLRDAFEAGDLPQPQSDPEITLVLAQARSAALPLLGPPLARLLPEIPAAHVRLAMRQGLPALFGNLQGDERNVVLTLARMWRTAAMGDFVAKDTAAAWAVARSPERVSEVLSLAADAYLGRSADDLAARQADVEHAAGFLHRQVSDLLEA